jgi:hypothetical protein
MRAVFRKTITEFQVGLSIALLGIFVAEVAAAVLVPVIVFGGMLGLATGIVAGVVVAGATRRPVGTLVARVIDLR